tara:strand:- start:909 stop:1130 length:222 start_codon:yes stop_codon:yes gene_type:complete
MDRSHLRPIIDQALEARVLKLPAALVLACRGVETGHPEKRPSEFGETWYLSFDDYTSLMEMINNILRDEQWPS